MQFVQESIIPAPVEAVFGFHERPDALARLTPPWERVTVIQPPTSLEVGTVVILRQRLGPLPITIVAEHVAYEKNVRFEDVMRKGPFRRWHHKHLFFPHPEGCRLRDEIEYEAPLGPLGRAVDGLLVRPRLQKMFDYRHEITRAAVVD
ncbi:MAG: SRPBCC family protein [Myxococcales bacterium]|nr:SRPBCC family protein [Myxococcales bacterium]MCB9753200.1 SRPBCC family protein [Myxococcales bacterium]